ncbi:MAG: ThuA domain-containing protein [bacterium]|nr:ThuA domain-containing protein [bacterium]
MRVRVKLLSALGILLGVLTLVGCDTLRVFFPSAHHDETAPVIPKDLTRPALLVFSKTNGFRHAEAIEAGLPAFEAIAAKRGWSVFATENGAIHGPELLSRFDAVIWFNVSGDVLADDQREALLDWIRVGGGFFGIHGTGGDSNYAWDAHRDLLVGAQFIGHPMGPQFQEGTIRIEAVDHPVVRHLGQTWSRVEEWYSFDESPRGPGVQILATLDESTYQPRMKIAIIDRDLRMGDDHPIIWTHCIGRGRAIFSALGHQGASYSESRHLTFLEEAVAWVMSTPSAGCRIPDSG